MGKLTMTQPVSVRLEDHNRTNVDRLAKMTKRSRSFIINEAVEAYLQDRIQYLEELNEAVADAQSGHGHSDEQVHAWMKSWGSKDEIPAPKPDIIPNA
jgi:predicted transcriptional regulator